MSRLIRFAKLPAAEKILFIEAFFFVAATRAGLWLVPFRIFQNNFRGFLSAKPEAVEPDWPQLERIVRAVKAASRFVPAASCLTQALAALFIVKLKGQEAELKIGVAKSAGADFEAHAWLERDGRILIGRVPGHGRFMVLNFSQGEFYERNRGTV